MNEVLWVAMVVGLALLIGWACSAFMASCNRLAAQCRQAHLTMCYPKDAFGYNTDFPACQQMRDQCMEY